METLFPDYKRCGINVSSSIMQYFRVQPAHDTLQPLDEILSKKKYRNIVLMLFDGMGIDALKNHLPSDSFLRTHVQETLSAVFPSTTTAAIPSIECAAPPYEHGWMGWTVYFEDIDKSVNVFTNQEQMSKNQAADYHVGSKFLPLDSVFDKINRQSTAKATCVSCHKIPSCKTLLDIRTHAMNLLNEEGEHFVYTYWGDPDHTMHKNGVKDASITQILKEIDRYVEDFAMSMPKDTLLLVTADHGLIDSENIFLSDYPDLVHMLLRPPTVEPRATAFHVKPEYKDVFLPTLKDALGDKFLYMTGEEFINSGLIGSGKKNHKLPSIVGDFVAIAVTPACILYSHDSFILKGVHAGLTKAEMQVPLIVFSR